MSNARNPHDPDLPRGWFGVLALNRQAWLAEKGTDAQVRILAARTRLINAQAAVVEAEWTASTRIVQAAHEYERARLGGTPVETAVQQVLTLTRQIGERQVAIERLLAEHDRRLVPPDPPSLPPAPVALDVVLSDAEIKRLAGKAVKRFSGLPSTEQEAAWSVWHAELKQRFPGLAAEEIYRAARDLNEIFR